MMKKVILVIASLCVNLVVFAQTQPKNIIIVKVDGLGYNHLKLYNKYSGQSFSIQNEYPTQCGSTNYPAYSNTITEPKNVTYYTGDYHIARVWSEFEYSDSMQINSATAGTALATGVKPAFNAVSVELDSTELETILERAFSIGKSTGILTDMALSQSGAASFVAHNVNAQNYHNIFNQILGSNLSFFAGCGNPGFNNVGSASTADYTYINKTDWDSLQAQKLQFNNGTFATDIDSDLQADAWTLYETKEDILAAQAKRIAIIPQTLDALQFKSDDYVVNQPTVSEIIPVMLQNLSKNPNGFVAVIEFGNVDFASKNHNKEQLVIGIDEIQVTLLEIRNYLQEQDIDDETLIIFVGSYETGYLTSNEFSKNPAKPKDLFTDYYINSETGYTFNSIYSTNLITPILATGPGSETLFNYTDEEDIYLGKYINNTEIAQICFSFLPKPTNPIKKPKNIILMINDGVGYNQIAAANYYTGKTQAYEAFPVVLSHSNYPLISTEEATSLNVWDNSYQSSLAWTDPLYLRNRTNATCSGASGTAIASGTKTYYYSLGVDVHQNAVNTIARHAKEIGKSAGVCANIPISDATPAVFFANNVSRNNGGEIYKQLILESKADVIIGGGHPEYDKHGVLKTTPNYSSTGDSFIWEGLTQGAVDYQTSSNSGWTSVQDCDGDGQPDPWTLVDDSASICSLITGPTPKRLLAIVPVENTMQFYRTGINANEVHFDDYNNGMPELWQLALVALNTLDNNPEGFFVMIEGDAADNAGHSNYKGRLIEEQITFNIAVDTVIEWIEANGGWDENLLIITSDHETGLLLGPNFNTDSIALNHYQIVDNGVGNIPGMEFYATHHSNQLVPLFAKGAGAELFNSYADERDYVRGNFINNSEIAQVMFSLWDGAPCTIYNNAVVISNPIPDMVLKINSDTTFSIPYGFAQDQEDANLRYQVTTRPKWLTVNDHQTLNFTAKPDKLGTSNVKILVTDGETSGAAISIETGFKIIVSESTSSTTISNNTVKTYPNPVTSDLHIKTTEDSEIIISDAQGKVLIKTSVKRGETSFPLQTFAPGTYIITIKSSKENIQKTIIVK